MGDKDREADTDALLAGGEGGEVQIDLGKAHQSMLFSANNVQTQTKKVLRSWKLYLAELVGTAIFAFVTEASAVATAPKSDHSLAPLLVGALVNGFTLVGVIYSLGTVSGAHFNPAVTVAAVIAKQLSIWRGLGYIGSQYLGGMLGTALVVLVQPDGNVEEHGFLGLFRLAKEVEWWRGAFVEVITTFILVFVIFCVVLNPHVTVDSAAHGTFAPLFAPISVGFTVTANILCSGDLTGGCMNPARAFGPILFTGHWENAQVYLIGPLIGGVLASVFQRIVFGKDPYFHNYDEDVQIN